MALFLSFLNMVGGEFANGVLNRRFYVVLGAESMVYRRARVPIVHITLYMFTQVRWNLMLLVRISAQVR